MGDGAFQEKSAKKMREIIDGGAATILVSHSIGQIRELATKVLWLHHGKQVALGETKWICDRYEAFLDGDESAMGEDWVPPEKRNVPVPEAGDWEEPAENFADKESIDMSENRFGLRYVEIEEAWVEDKEGKRCDELDAGSPFAVAMRYRVRRRLEEYVFGFSFSRVNGEFISGSNTKLDGVKLPIAREGVVRARFDCMPFLPGEYVLQVAVVEKDDTPMDFWKDHGHFTVTASDKSVGLITMPHTWSSGER